ncbi:MAG: phosphotransferase [Gammaproteobacteria bacterium]
MTANDLAPFMETMVGHGPSVPPEFVERVVRDHYGLDVHADRLTGERDENFRVRAGRGAEYMLKIANAAEQPSITQLSTAALLHMEKVDPGFPCPRVCRARNGQPQIQFDDPAGQVRTARLVTFLSGKRLLSVARSKKQRASCGRLAARLARALRNFEHPASHHMVIWDLQHVPLLHALLADVPGLPAADFISEFVTDFEARVAPRLATVRHQFVHNDLNVGNILVDEQDDSRVAGVIDFGDAVHTALIADVAIALVGQITTIEAMDEVIGDFLGAYQEVEPLQSTELEILNALVAARIVQGLLIPSWHRAKNPSATHFDAFDDAHVARRVAMVRRLMSGRITRPEPSLPDRESFDQAQQDTT